MLTTVTTGLNLPAEKMQKDLDLYRSNLEKMNQVLAVLEDALLAERKRREKEEAEAQAKVAASIESPETTESSADA